MLAARVMGPCVAQPYFVCVCDATGAPVFSGTSAVRRLRSLRWQAIRILWHQSSRVGLLPALHTNASVPSRLPP